MLNIKKLLSVFLIFILIFSSISISFADTSKVYKIDGETYIVNKDLSKEDLISLVMQKQISKEGLREIIFNIRKISASEIRIALKGTKRQKKVLVNKIFGNGLLYNELENLLDKGYIKSKGKDFLIGSKVLYPGVGWKPSGENNNYPGVGWKPSENGEKEYPGVGWKPGEQTNIQYPGVGWREPENVDTNLVKLNTSFLSKIRNGEYKVNFTNIDSKNAGKVQAKFVGKNNFPNKIKLEEGFSLEIDSESIESSFSKKNILDRKISNLRSNGVDLGNIVSLPIELNILPDRIQYISKTQFEFQGKKQLDNLKTNFSDLFKDDNFHVSNDRVSQKGKQVSSDVRNTLKTSLSKLTDTNLYVALKQDCINDGFEDCSQEAVESIYDNSVKTLTTTEMVEISLIPPTIEDVKAKKQGLLLKPELVRISKTKILQNFENLKLLNQIQVLYPMNQEEEVPEEVNSLSSDNYCENKYVGNNSRISECNQKLNEYNRTTTANYRKELLNGFTLGEEKNNHWGIEITIKIKNPFNGNVVAQRRMFELSLDNYYSYGFGLRIPVVANGQVSDNLVDNFTNSNATYTSKIKVDTLDADKDYYKRVGLDDTKVFNGKEFVLELTAGTRAYVYLRHVIDREFHFPIVSMYMTKFGDQLLDAMGITDSMVRSLGIEGIDSREKLKNYVIHNNGFDFGRNFKPPFSHSERIQLTDLALPYFPVYTDGALFIHGQIGLRSFLRGKVSVKCDEINSTGGCAPKRQGNRIDLETKNWYTGNGIANYNPRSTKSDILGDYSNFGVKYHDFKYHPVLDTEVWARVKGTAQIPGIGKVVHETPQIVVYSFTLESDDIALGTHRGTNGDFIMSDQNKVYNSKSTLGDIEEIRGLEVKGQMLGESNFKIIPADNYTGTNKTYYTLDGTNPSCTGRGIEYRAASQLWPDYRIDISPLLTANKAITVKAISCDTLTNKQTPIKTKQFLLKNYYHKPVYRIYSTKASDLKLSYSDPLVTKQYNYYMASDEINSSSKGEYIKLGTASISPLINESFIKYKYYYPGESRNPNDDLKCEDGYGIKYNNERITFKSFQSNPYIKANERVFDTSRVGNGEDVNIYAIQCIRKNDLTYYKSYTSHFVITNRTISSRTK